MKRFSTFLMMFLLLMGVSSNAQDLVMTGIVDGPLPGGLPKAIELYAINNIADLSVYGLESANNGGAAAGPEFYFPADAASAGEYIYVAYDDATLAFPAFFGFAPNYIDNVANNNGDDAIILYLNDNPIDVFGEVGVDGTGTPWESLDGWVYRVSGTGPDGTTFVLGNWTYSGIDALDGETTNASAANPWPLGTYTASASTTVATPVISPATGDYFAPITVTMTCGTDGATIRYTTNGSDPTPSSTIYISGFSVSTTTTVKARAYKAGMTESSIATRVYTFPTVTNINTIATLRAQATGTSYYKLTSQAILTFQQTYRNNKFIQDATAAILIDDLSGKITSTYNLYDGITGIIGTLADYGGMLQFTPATDPGSATSTGNTITPQVVTLAQLTSSFENYEAELVKVQSAVFADAGTNFANGIVYSITDGSKSTYNFRTTFYDVDYIGTAIPSGPQDLVMIPHSRTDGEFVASRSLSDINESSSANPAVKLDITAINSGNPVYENQPFTVKVQSLDVNNVPANVTSNVNVTLSVGTGTGTLGGTITGTIATGTNSVTISGVTYGPHENNVVLNVAGGSLTSGNSDPFNVLEVIIPDLVITEIMYHAMPGEDTLEYIEIYNNGSSTINLLDYSFTQGVELTFPSYNLTAGSYVLVAKNSSAIEDAFGVSSIQWTSGGLNNTAEDIEITDTDGNVVCYVDYTNTTPWPVDAVGHSLRFCNPDLPNNVAANWSSSSELIATIGGQDIFGSPMAGCGADPLIADFEADNTSIMAGESVNFTDLSVGSPTSWTWTFTGGTPSSSSAQNPSNIVYNTPGTYNVSLTIHRGADSDTETKTGYIEVGDPTIPPVANFEADVTTIFVGQSVHYTNLSQNNPTIFNWTFEGGTPASSSAQNPTVVYNTAGTFDVTLYVENSAGNDELSMPNLITVLPASVGDLVITEIMYNPPEADTDTLEYVEIYNNSSSEINLFGYNFSSGIEYIFPNITIGSGDYMVIAKDSVILFNTFGVSSHQWTSGSLSNGGELLLLSSPLNITVDSVPFADVSPWPTEADGNGPSITICNPETENSIGDNWHASVHFLANNGNNDPIYGSPGMAPAPVANFGADNSFIGVGDQVQFSDLSTCNATSYSWEFEGGTPATSSDPDPLVTYAMAGAYDVTLTVTNATGSNTLTMVEYIQVGVGTVEQSLENISVYPNPSTGVYKIQNPNNQEIIISVYNILGELILEHQAVRGDDSIDILNEQNGIYLLQITANGEKRSMRIIKQ